jgi:hypothetical protein
MFVGRSSIPSIRSDDKSKPECAPEFLHISMFSFSNMASSKMAPLIDTSTQLVDEFFVDGFLSDGDPLYVKQPMATRDDRLVSATKNIKQWL